MRWTCGNTSEKIRAKQRARGMDFIRGNASWNTSAKVVRAATLVGTPGRSIATLGEKGCGPRRKPIRDVVDRIHWKTSRSRVRNVTAEDSITRSRGQRGKDIQRAVRADGRWPRELKGKAGRIAYRGPESTGGLPCRLTTVPAGNGARRVAREPEFFLRFVSATGGSSRRNFSARVTIAVASSPLSRTDRTMRVRNFPGTRWCTWKWTVTLTVLHSRYGSQWRSFGRRVKEMPPRRFAESNGYEDARLRDRDRREKIRFDFLYVFSQWWNVTASTKRAVTLSADTDSRRITGNARG